MILRDRIVISKSPEGEGAVKLIWLIQGGAVEDLIKLSKFIQFLPIMIQYFYFWSYDFTI